MDDVRLVKMLLSNTQLRVKLKSEESSEFLVNIGSFQGDSLSGKSFTLYLAAALRHMRAILKIPDPPIDLHTMMPLETVYADDCDFYSTDKHAHEKAVTKIEKKLVNGI